MAAKNGKSERNARARSGSNENRSAPRHPDVEALTKQIQQLTASSPILSAFLETLLVSLNQICSLEAALDDSVRLSIQETQTANGKVLRALEAIGGQRAILDSKQEIIQSVINILEGHNFHFELETRQKLAHRKEALVKDWMARFARIAYE